MKKKHFKCFKMILITRLLIMMTKDTLKNSTRLFYYHRIVPNIKTNTFNGKIFDSKNCKKIQRLISGRLQSASLRNSTYIIIKIY